jgi:hypothetical protein
MSGSADWSAPTDISRSELLRRVPLVYEAPHESLESELEGEMRRKDGHERWRKGKNMVREGEMERWEGLSLDEGQVNKYILPQRKSVTPGM